tara:strand:- start:706 stop:1467 length:762 start_codon:yes stop_codon:yes gene_type:complete
MKRPTVGAILDAIDVVQAAEDEEAKKKALKKLEKSLGWKVAKMLAGPFGDAVSIAKDAAGVYKTLKDTKKAPEKMDNPILDLLQVDSGYKNMLDDSVEFEFDKDMVSYLNSLPREAPLPDMTVELEKWIQKKFNRGISGADVTEVIFRKHIGNLIREAIENESQFRELLEAGHFDQAIALADSLGISGRELPWTGELLEDYVYEKLKNIPIDAYDDAKLVWHQAKIDALNVLDISLEEYMGPSPLMMYYNSRR